MTVALVVFAMAVVAGAFYQIGRTDELLDRPFWAFRARVPKCHRAGGVCNLALNPGCAELLDAVADVSDDEVAAIRAQFAEQQRLEKLGRAVESLKDAMRGISDMSDCRNTVLDAIYREAER